MARQYSGARLRQARVAAGLSAEQLAQRINRHTITVYNYERTAKRPSVNVLAAAADALQQPLDFFFTDPAADRAA